MNSTVVAFPLCRQRKLVSGIARVLRSKHGEAANLFWRYTSQALLHRQMETGIEADAAVKEVRKLLTVVLAEIEADEVAAQR